MEFRPVQCTILKPVYVNVTRGSEDISSCSGCSIISVSFPNALHADVDKITFRNYYTASLSVYAKPRSMAAELLGSWDQATQWRQCIRHTRLMPCPHSENSAEDRFELKPLESLKNVSELRFILRQPSLMWKDFRIDDIKIYREVEADSSSGVEVKKDNTLECWLSRTSHENLEVSTADEEKVKLSWKSDASVSQISSILQHLWALTETVRHESSSSLPSLQRFDINGCYDINMLSYT